MMKMGDCRKDARALIRKARAIPNEDARFNYLARHIEEQARALDGDERCIACSRWIHEEDWRGIDEDGFLCRKCFVELKGIQL